MGHVGLEAQRLRPVDHFQQFEHPPPTVHAAPADLALGRQPLAVILGDLAGLAEGLGDPLLVALGILAPSRLDAAGRVDPHHAVGPHAQLAELLRDAAGLADLGQELPLRLRRCPWPSRRRCGGQTGATTCRSPGSAPRALSASAFDRRRSSRCRCAASKRNRSKPSNRTPSTSAAAVRSSIVSRSIGGSASCPLPTTPGHAALWKLGVVVGTVVPPVVFVRPRSPAESRPTARARAVQHGVADLLRPQGRRGCRAGTPARRLEARQEIGQPLMNVCS